MKKEKRFLVYKNAGKEWCLFSFGSYQFFKKNYPISAELEALEPY